MPNGKNDFRMTNIGAFKIREATSNDLPSVYGLVCKLENETLKQEVFAQIFEANLKSPNCFYCVAETENRIVGFISFHLQHLLHHCGAVGEVQEFYLDKDFRNKGIGKRLMDEVKKYAEAKNVKSLEVTSNKKRTENIKVYESLGFKLTHNKFTI
jgi:PhnO protein